MERTKLEVGREAKREFRKRGSARRELDLDDLVLDLPPPLPPHKTVLSDADAERNDDGEAEKAADRLLETASPNKKPKDALGLEEETEFPHLPPPRVISEAERRVVEKHRELAARRLQQRLEEKQMVIREAKHVKHIKRTAAVRSKSIKLKYRRMPSNKARLIYTDVISQVIKDYLRAPSTVERYTSGVAGRLHETAKKKKRGRKSKKLQQTESSSDKEIKQRAKTALKEYYDRVNEYFTSLIDLQLSNALIRSDLEKINAEKDKLRMQIFELRKERGVVGLEITEVRDEFRRLNSHFSVQDKHYKQLITLQEEGSFSKQGEVLSQDKLIDEINYRLDKYGNMPNTTPSCLKSLRRINALLGELPSEK
ncbi:hypothetical protein PICMEDRAFT_71997 [Pichia membranifaciens NRRL Y-2026]|uniref:Inner kinetochore subunit AME1 domain-containing protein n=1 Tax=Pichia membranifaciens NRRL Y-2026 TaxID=763406 RepID=A0A1E3NPI0_9ASCO|nr:hypothetical protein PICMEDRAFT_71997 [Pichia membranifaciens NRRL Y-2026]ODQ47999.1 hypothetical protein PICMEDRAFT_71997 [Pichia membranifaciens NRRL Y-2026]